LEVAEMAERKHDALLINQRDNVAVAIRDLVKGQRALVKGEGFEEEIELLEDVPFGHKFAVRDLETAEKVIKYGQTIGKASRKIRKGDHVHDHNIEGIRGRGDTAAKEDAR